EAEPLMVCGECEQAPSAEGQEAREADLAAAEAAGPAAEGEAVAAAYPAGSGRPEAPADGPGGPYGPGPAQVSPDEAHPLLAAAKRQAALSLTPPPAPL